MIMAKSDKSGWSACDEFNETLTTKPIKQIPQIKTLTRATKKNIDQIKTNLKNQLPALTSVGVRRYRLPYYECVLLELKECGMAEIAECIDKLFEKSKEFNDEVSLKFENHLIERLKNCLVNAELAKRNNKHMEELTTLFDTAIFFQSLSCQWLWIVHELLKRALSSAAMIHDDGMLINIFKFIYGQFLFRQLNDIQQALHYLNEVRNASKGKNWNSSKFLKTKHHNLSKECNILLYEIYYIMAEKYRSINSTMSIEMSFDALKCANDSEYNEYIAKSLYGLGESLLKAKNITGALKIFAKFLAKVKRIPDHRGICDAHKQLAIARQSFKDYDGAQKHLQLFRECANEYRLPDKIADAHYLTGKYLLECGLPNDASSYLRKAFDMYKSLEIQERMNESRYLLGISTGEEVLETFMKLILDSGNKDKNATIKLLQWKIKRTPFWSS